MTIAVCMCTHRRPEALRASLEAIGAALRAHPVGEPVVVVVADNHPDGEAEAVCRALRPNLPAELIFTEDPARGIPLVRNRAVCAAVASGASFVAFLDDDDLPRPDWLIELLRLQVEEDADLVFGTWQWPDDTTIPQAVRAVMMTPDTGLLNRFGTPRWAGTYNVLISRRIIDRLAPDGRIFAPECVQTGAEDTDFFAEV
jgi:succinoglycan biosynthesis protein ExoM